LYERIQRQAWFNKREPPSQLNKIAVDIQGAVKDTKDVDFTVEFDEISYSIVTVERNSDGAMGLSLVLVTNFGMLFE